MKRPSYNSPAHKIQEVLWKLEANGGVVELDPPIGKRTEGYIARQWRETWVCLSRSCSLNNQFYTRYCCGRNFGHKGVHAAYNGDDEMVAVWFGEKE